MNSPFIYGSVVSTKSFTNREKDSAKLTSNLISGINTMIISPRRWGKSSLVAKVFNDIQKKKNKTVLLNKDMINKTEEGFELLDPVFEIWLKSNFLTSPFE
ncbi:MAG: AAA-like domain-containing protein [Melioribacteraceae bacterium]|nr:AAA-like domain-containing protein [Melioribacteraceae bacterium]